MALRDDRGLRFVGRRVTVELDAPTRDGDTEVHILTNLPAAVASAARVAELYRRRWTIEAAFADRFRGSREEVTAKLRPYLGDVARVLRPAERGPRVLDVGCGRAEWLTLLRDEGIAARGIDANVDFATAGRTAGLDVVHGDGVAYLAAREEGLDTFDALEEIGQPGLAQSTAPLELFQAERDVEQQSANG